MPTYKAVVNVMIKPSILDPQGRAVEATLKRLGHTQLSEVRIGKHIELTMQGERAAVEAELKTIAETVLSNPVMEDVSYTLTELGSRDGA
jgi:phosphoribosylformylglycinamidine synthase